MNAIELKKITKKYGDNIIFSDYNLNIEEGEFVGIKGKSGKGKTTLLNIIGLLEKCEGQVIIMGEEIKTKKEKRMILRDIIGYLFQNFALIDDLSVYENLKVVLRGKDKKNMELLRDALEKVQLTSGILNKKIYTCSGGEQQRIAIARLILKDSKIILADEPTGSLDKDNTDLVMKLLLDLNKVGKTIVMVSHDDYALSFANKVIEL